MLVTFFFSLSINEQEKKMKKKQQVKLPELPSSSPPSGSGKAEGVNGDRGDKAEPLVSGRALCVSGIHPDSCFKACAKA